MRRYAKPLVNHYKNIRWSPEVPKKVKTILNDRTVEPLKQADSSALINFYMANQKQAPTLTERNYVIRYLYEKHAFTNVVTFGKKFLFVNGGGSNLREDASFNELKRYLKAVIRTERFYFLDVVMTQVISQFSLNRRSAVIDIINSVFVDLNDYVKSKNEIDAIVPILKWNRWIKLLMGHCDFSNYIQYKYVLKTLLFFLRQKRKNDEIFFQRSLNAINTTQGPSSASQFATTLMYLFAYDGNTPLVETMWSFKVEKGLPIVASDLTTILKSYCYFQKYSLVQQTYDKYPEAHNDQSQFDYLLVAYANSANWQGLQDQFNALFGVGELPNIKHYGIVMYSMARIGELESVDKLYTQLLRREMIPNYPVLQSLLLAHYKTGDLNSCFAQFELFGKYSVVPSTATYTIMFKVYRGLSDLDGSLRLLKRMTENDRNTITEQHFAIPIHLCSRFTNIAVAQELFTVMLNHYDIEPTGVSIAALMDVYIESGMPQEALKLFKRYGNLKPVEHRLISVYNKAIKAFINMNDRRNCEIVLNEVVARKITTDAEFYNMTIRYLVEMKRDFETAEQTLEHLMKHPKVKVNASHFETIMSAYDKISHRDGVLTLYKKMVENKIAVNSKILHLLIKSTFKVQMQTKGDLQQAIDLLNRVMESAANHSLDITYWRLHPSVMSWPVRIVAKFYSPMKALELLNRYNELFYPKEESWSNNRFSIMRSLLVLSAETEHWEDFDNIFQKYVSRISQYQRLGSSSVRNEKLCTLFVGILFYKIRHLAAMQNITALPPLLVELEEKRFVIDNNSWNEAIQVMFEDSRTIDAALKIVNEKLIHGYNLIHKYRLLKKLAETSATMEQKPWLLQQKKQAPHSFEPTLYLKSDVYVQIMESMDRYLNNCSEISKEIKTLIEKYPYFMKNYLMKPRMEVNGWSQIEDRHASYLESVRSKKRIVPASEF
ncbi:hypothetical protein HG535_0D05980 [Zygotorulaspora mrakii]|uniref:Pentacotripeptide-repeat region of PRORP domain-containing protein n=1 Tax=Zygotorulaspora mrakii TaxID=42260 RepID=A0A7H9B4J0_ZYGMR|nr:uncharacterized protein HG535_0D05980 [Zygotorulaspora mrakii]QLG72889.1 hypothetical protein HG535_0D05980 [Zygotorulaspora mrakii]